MAKRVKINGQDYLLPTTVEDITLGTFIAWTEIEAAQMPAELRAIVLEKDADKKQAKARQVSKRVYIRKMIPYYARVISTLSGIPLNILLGDRQHEGAPVLILESWYWQIVNALARFEYDPGRSKFQINGETWTLPAEHMEKSTFGEFAEAAQYEEYASEVAGGNWAKMPYVMAVLLRPEGEEFDPYTFDDHVEERAEIMRAQTMDVVYQVSFFLLERSENLKIDSLIYTLSQVLATSKPGLRN